MREIHAVLLSCLLTAPCLAGEWTIEEVGEVGMYSDLAVDAEGTPHVAISGLRGLVYATRGRRGWTREDVAEFDASLAAQVSIALDGDQRPAIVWANKELELARRGRRGWSSESVLDQFHGNGECQLVLRFQGDEAWVFVHDPYKEPAVQVGHGKRRLRFKALDKTAADGGGIAVFQGQIYAVWQEDANSRLLYAVSSGKNFAAPVQLAESSAVHPKVAASADALYVLSATRKPFSKVLRLHTLREAAWTTQDVGEYRLEGGPCVPHLATGPDGAPHLLFVHSNKDDQDVVTYAVRDSDGAWKTSDVSAQLGTRMSLVVDGQGRPHVTFADQKSSKLFYATPSGPLSFARGEAHPEKPTPVAGADGPRAGGGEPAGGDRGEAGDGDGEGAKPDSEEPAPDKPESDGPESAKPKGPAPITGPEAEALAAVVRDRAERWFAARDADKLACQNCDGSAHVRCKTCRGTQKLACRACGGRGEVRRPKGSLERYKDCSACRAKGEFDCEACDEGQQACERCSETPGYRSLSGMRAFWKFATPSSRRGLRRDAFFADVLAGRVLADALGKSPSILRAEIQRVDVFSNEVVVTARVHWTGEFEGEASLLTTTWIRENGKFYLAAGHEDRPPLFDTTGERSKPGSGR